MKRTFFRVIKPDTFANSDHKTLDEAKKNLIAFGSVSENSEHFQYWQDKKKQCKIVKVTEIIEEVNY